METTREDCIELVDELNAELTKVTFFENYFNIRFKYMTEGYDDYIMLGDIILYTSQDGCLYKWRDGLPVEITLREYLLKELKKLLFNTRKMSFWVHNELKSYEIKEDNSTD